MPVLQVGGQQAIGPARAQVIYASGPLWAALISLVALGETVGVEGCVGGAAFLTAVLIAASAPAPDPNCFADDCEI
jgi:drug/metabolite transporter (DMT)-like permease